MAEFEPVGVRAVLEGIDKFMADLRKMQVGIRSLVATFHVNKAQFAETSASAATASAAMTGFSSTISNTSSVARTFGGNVGLMGLRLRDYSGITGNASQVVRQLGDQLAFLKLRNIENLNATTRAISNNRVLSSALINLTSKYNETAAAQGMAAASAKRLEQEALKEIRIRNNLAQQIKKEEKARLSNEIKLERSIGTYKKYEAQQMALHTEISELEAKEKTTRNAIEQVSAAMKRKIGAASELEKKMTALTMEQDQWRANVAQSTTAIVNHRNEIAISQQRSEDWRAKLAAAGQEALDLNNKLRLLAAGMKAVWVAGTVLAGIKTIFAGITTAAKLAANAILLPTRAISQMGKTIRAGAAWISEHSKALFKLGNSIRFYGMSMVFFISLPIVGFLKTLVNAAMEFEEAFAGVIKTVDDLVKPGTLNELTAQGEQLRQGLRNMAAEIPIAASQLAGLAQIAGQLGIRGSKNILAFTKTSAMMGVATDLAAEDAARMLAQVIAVTGPLNDAELAMAGYTIEEIRGISPAERFRATVDATAAAVVNLGNKLPVGEEAILRFTQRIAAIGNVAGLAIPDIVAVASAFASVGVPSERGGTAVQKTFVTMIKASQEGGEALQIFADLAGQTVEEFSNAFVVGGEQMENVVQNVMVGSVTTAMDAIGKAIDQGGESLYQFANLAEMSAGDFADAIIAGGQQAGDAFARVIGGFGRNAKQIIPIFEELELTDARLMNALLSLSEAESSSIELETRIAEALRVSREGFQRSGDTLSEYNALQLEAARRFATTSSKVELMKNQIKDLGITLGSIFLPTVSKAVEAVRNLARRIEQLARTEGGKKIIQLVTAFLLLVAAIGPAVIALGLIMSTIGFFVGAIGAVVGAIGTLISWLGLLAIPALALATAFAGLGIAFVAAMQHIVNTTEEGAKGLIPRMWEFGRNLILAFAKGMAAAMAAIIVVLNAIGRIIATWLKPGSPPKLLPDIDKWGAQTMTEYLKGWLEADFSIFDELAGKLESLIRAFSPQGDDVDQAGIIERILGTRKAVADAINMVKEAGKVTTAAINKITSALGQQSTLVKNYAKALLEVELAEQKLADAQERINEITKRYAELLKPIEGRLKEIADRQEEVRREFRITELETILQDPRATPLVRELAQLELEQISLEVETDELENARDAELELAQAQADAAQAQLDAAREQLKVAEGMLDIQIRNRELMNEMIAAAEAAAKKLKDAGGALGDIEPFEDLVDDVEANLGGLDFTELDASIDEVIDNISKEFELLILDLKAIFAPLKPLWEELGATWAPIFEKARYMIGGIFAGFDPFEGMLPSQMKQIEEKLGLDEIDSGFQQWKTNLLRGGLITDEHIRPLTEAGEQIEAFLRGPLTELVGFMIDIGLISPFGKFKEEAEQLGKLSLPFELDGDQQSFTKLGQTFKDISADVVAFKGAVKELWEGPLTDIMRFMIDIGLVQPFGKFKEEAKAVGEDNALTKLGTKLQELLDFFDRIGQTITSSDWFTLINTAFSAMLDSLSQISTSGIFESLQESLGLIGQAFSDMYVAMEEAGVIDMLVTGLKILAGITGGALVVSLGILVGIFTALARQMEFVLPFIGIAISGITNIVTGIIQVLTGMFQFVVNLVALIVGLIKGNEEIVTKASERLQQAVADIFGGLIRIIEGIVATIFGIVGAFGAGFIGLLLGFFEGIANYARLFLENFTGLWASAFYQVSTKIDEWVNSAIKWFEDLFDKIVGIFEDLFNALIGHSIISDMFEAILTATSNFVGDMIESFSGFVTELIAKAVELADGIINGLVTGLQNGAQTVIDTVVGLVGGAIEAAKKFLGIGSPSREFLQVGADTVAGLKAGLEQDAGKIGAVMESMASNMVQVTKQAIEGIVSIWDKGFTIVESTVEKGVGSLSSILIKTLTSMLDTTSSVWGTKLTGLTRLLSSWIRSTLDKVLEMAKIVSIGGDKSYFGQMFGFILSKLLPDFVVDFETAFRDFVTLFTEIVLAMAKVVSLDLQSSLFGRMFDTIVSILLPAFRSAFMSGIEEFVNDFKKILEDLLKIFEEEKIKWQQMGEALMDSLAAGLEAKRGDLMRLAQDIADEIRKTIEEALEFGSPSKVMVRIGEEMIKSWIIGMENMRGGLALAAGALAASASARLEAQRAASPRVTNIVNAPAIPAAGGAGTVVNAPIDMGGQTINNGIDAITLQILLEQALRNVLQ